MSLTDSQIDKLLSVPIPGGSQARDWFLPHEDPRGLNNVRHVVRLMFERGTTIETDDNNLHESVLKLVRDYNLLLSTLDQVLNGTEIDEFNNDDNGLVMLVDRTPSSYLRHQIKKHIAMIQNAIEKVKQ